MNRNSLHIVQKRIFLLYRLLSADSDKAKCNCGDKKVAIEKNRTRFSLKQDVELRLFTMSLIVCHGSKYPYSILLQEKKISKTTNHLTFGLGVNCTYRPATV
jgi:hypothetical protein